MDILDLHDFYDFNITLKEKSSQIAQDVLSGQYTTKPPLIYKAEKKYGICRHLMLPNPSDALVLQTLVESITPLLDKATPTKRAFYSRDKSAKQKLPHELHGQAGGYEWRDLWKTFQKEIYQFSNESEYLVVTDLTNYYDNIGLRELRHVVSSRIHAPEVILDLLFRIIEQLSWVPDYLPASLKGLPTINLEAPRLLAHVLLFEVDEVLEQRTAGNFVRWMDDINFGASTRDEAFETLGAVNDVLKSRGLALNIAKTSVYSKDELQDHFFFETNKDIDELEVDIWAGGAGAATINQILSMYEAHAARVGQRNWDNVTKRLLTVAARTQSAILLDKCSDLFTTQPGLRKHVCYYLASLGFRASSAKVAIEILEHAKVYDDVTRFCLVKALTDWRIPTDAQGASFLKYVSSRLLLDTSPFGYYATLWFLSKYGNPGDVATMVETGLKHWGNNVFLRRQSISAMPRMFAHEAHKVGQLLDEEIRLGPDDSASVARSIRQYTSLQDLPFEIRSYVFPTARQRVYPLPKFLILLALFQAPGVSSNKAVLDLARSYVDDPWMRHWLFGEPIAGPGNVSGVRRRRLS